MHCLSRCNLCRTGGAGEKVLMPGTGFLTVGAASALAFCQVLREEYPEVPCKLNQVCLLCAVKVSSNSPEHGKFMGLYSGHDM